MTHLRALEASADRLRALVTPLDDTALEQRAYPTEWTTADVLSHLGSGAEIAWSAKSPRAEADDGLRSDQELVDRIAAVTDTGAASVRIPLGPLELDMTAFVALRLNEHAFHTWDIAVTLDPKATIPADAVARWSTTST